MQANCLKNVWRPNNCNLQQMVLYNLFYVELIFITFPYRFKGRQNLPAAEMHAIPFHLLCVQTCTLCKIHDATLAGT